MPRAVDTVLAFSTQAGSSAFPTALAAATGDSLQVRGVKGESAANLIALITQSNAAGQQFRIKSPLMHDNVTGMTYYPPENPGLFLIPSEASVQLNQLDTITAQGACGAAYTITMGMVIYYDDIRGAAAELYTWEDIRSDIKYIKAVEVDNLAIAVGAWTDTPLTNTEDQLHADKSYAVLGYAQPTATALTGIKGIATGNLRMCGPGGSQSLDLSDYYIQMSLKHGKPYIPIMQANDRKAFYVSQANGAALGAAAANVVIIMAELKTKR